VRREDNPKTQVQTANLGHPPLCFDLRVCEGLSFDSREFERVEFVIPAAGLDGDW